VHNAGGTVFLDLKYHDIPNTVQEAAAAAASLGIEMFNVHALGGIDMMRAAAEGARSGGPTRPLVLGVTILTSHDQTSLNEDIGISGTLYDNVFRLAHKARQAGLDGIVCAGADTEWLVPKLLWPSCYIVTPGIAAPGATAGADQKRVATPAYAVRHGASLVVCGRAITAKKSAEERQQAAYATLQDIASAL
jgi:orotidine-5'-phosphate decarboxylase